MRIGIATDHGGYGLEQQLVVQLRVAGHEVIDFGAQKPGPRTCLISAMVI
jgi:ribose 5-phosphate isomerase RpiB